MKTIALSNFVGFEVSTIQEVVKAQACGLVIMDKDMNGYDYPYEYQDEEGEWTESDPTEQQVFERIAEDIKDGKTLLAGFFLDTDKYNIVPSKQTTMQTDFYVGQEVFTMKGNKVIKARIQRLWLSRGGETYFKNTEYVTSDIVREMRNCVTTLSANKATLDYISSRIAACKAMEEDFAYLVNKDNNFYKLVKLSEMFATKEDLVKHLMEE